MAFMVGSVIEVIHMFLSFYWILGDVVCQINSGETELNEITLYVFCVIF